VVTGQYQHGSPAKIFSNQWHLERRIAQIGFVGGSRFGAEQFHSLKETQMNRLGLRPAPSILVSLTCSILLAACCTAVAQTTTPTKPKTPPPATPVKPAAKAVAAPVAKTATTPAAKAAAPLTSGAQPVSQSAVQTVQQPASTSSQTTPSNLLSTAGTAQTQSNALLGNSSAPAGDSRTPVVGQGLGNFLWGPWSLTAYGCFRTGTRIFCDFDAGSTNNVQAGANLWSGVNLVDDGGKVTSRHNAFFLANDGTQMNNAYFSPGSPVRMIMEYDDVAQNYTSVSLVVGADRIRGVPVTPADPSQPAGTIPGRGTASASGQAPASGQTPAASPVDKANQALNTATTQQKKAQGFLDQLKSAVQSH
jgi:hypothetical protein